METILNKIFEEINGDSRNNLKILLKYENEIEEINPKLLAICKLLTISSPVINMKKDDGGSHE